MCSKENEGLDDAFVDSMDTALMGSTNQPSSDTATDVAASLLLVNKVQLTR